ncbi:MAG: TIGR02453 family protein [Sneathiella sp.]|nr:MAG: TIGR02453 family protein [Sneathiella sp.]
MSTSFSGFPSDLITFYEELAANNNRDWFAANKQRYKDVVVYPMCDFIEAVAPRLDAIAPMYIADSRPNGGSMFRIYRDVRFSRDPKPYKEHAACQFRHQAGKDAHAPGFYLHIALDGVRFGGGVWLPPPPFLAKIRSAIDENGAKWNAIKQDPDFAKTFPEIRGDGLKTAPKGYSIDHPDIVDLRRKTFFVMKPVDDIRAITKPGFIDDVEDTFQKATPFMRFLTNAVELPF